jgi:prepilin-type N-terminal cleavage/methylation domain-containing protein
MRKSVPIKGFTLIELLIALVVTSIVLTAVSTLAFAISSANKTTDNTNHVQSQVRLTTLKIQELIRNCCLICKINNDDIAIWRSDDNSDNNININELVYIERGADRDHLRFYTFNSVNISKIELSSIGSISSNWWTLYSNKIEYINLLSECSNVDFKIDKSPPECGLLSISFQVSENNNSRQYEINAALRSKKINLLDGSANIISDDD